MKHTKNEVRRRSASYGDGYSRTEPRRRAAVYDEDEEVIRRPRKPKKKVGLLLKILTVLFAVIFVVSGGVLLWEMVIAPYFADQTTDEIRTLYSDAAPSTDDTAAAQETRAEEYAKRVAAITKLQTVNTDITGWIKLENTEINYPVLTPPADDSEYYLYRDYKKEDTKYGSIFMDKNSSVSTDNALLHGHSMQDGRMFWDLIDFSNVETLKKSPVIRYDTELEAGDWKIVSVFKTNTYASQGALFDYTRSTFSDDADKMQFLYEVMKRSIVNTGVDLNENDKTIMLSTCSYEREGFRTVVVARKVRENEDATVDTSRFATNENALYPDAWYASGEAPDYWPETLADAISAGKIDWYTGSLYG